MHYQFLTSVHLLTIFRLPNVCDDFAAEACADLESATWTTNAISEIARADSNAWWQVTERHDVPVSQAPRRFMRLRVEAQQ